MASDGGVGGGRRTKPGLGRARLPGDATTGVLGRPADAEAGRRLLPWASNNKAAAVVGGVLLAAAEAALSPADAGRLLPSLLMAARKCASTSANESEVISRAASACSAVFQARGRMLPGWRGRQRFARARGVAPSPT